MAYRKALSIIESFAFSTSAAALLILKNGSEDLLTAFKYGAFEESASGVTLRSPTVSIDDIEKIGTSLFLMQIDALVAEMESLGIKVKEYRHSV